VPLAYERFAAFRISKREALLSLNEPKNKQKKEMNYE
jgi:hypothetical protein